MSETTQSNAGQKAKTVPLYRKAGRFLRRLLIAVCPDNCPLCNASLMRGEQPLCLNCLSRLPRIEYDRQVTYIGAPQYTIDVKSWFIYSHDHPSHKLIHDIKYHDRVKLARKLGREFAMQKLLDYGPIDLILPIPLHWAKYVSRSYNQTVEIARGIADVVDVKIGNNLRAVRAHSSQTRRNRQERLANVKGIFDIRRPEELDGKNIAILDDVITTGATMFSALETILAKSAPASVTFLSLARTRDS